MSGLRARIGRGGLSLLAAACIALPGSMAGAETVTKPLLPGEMRPADPTATQPPEIQPKTPNQGVIKPPGDISRMPVIKPNVPSRMPVIPPSRDCQPPDATRVVPK